MRHSELAECRELSQKLFEVTKEVAPSLIILTDPQEFKKAFKTELKDDHFKYTRLNLKKIVKEMIGKYREVSSENVPEIISESNEKLILEHDVDKNIAAAIIHRNSLLSIEESFQIAAQILSDEANGKEFFSEVLKFISAFDSLPREFEFTGDLKYELVVSASNFAQLKRHRLMTLLSQDYDPTLGITIPASIKAIGADAELMEVCRKSEELYYEFLPKYGKAAEYCLTNAHRRKVLIVANPRELYHLSRLREDEHAQWDIKATAGNMMKLAKKAAPLSFMLSGGKDLFEEQKAEKEKKKQKAKSKKSKD